MSICLKSTTIASLTLVLMSGSAMATDVYKGDKSLKEDANYASGAVHSWTGFYIGAHGGAGWADISVIDVDSYNGKSGDFDTHDTLWFGGAQAGYNIQRDRVVFGIEGDLGYFDLDAKQQFPGFIGDPKRIDDSVASVKSDLYGDITGRIGLTHRGLLVYAKGGAAFLNTELAYVDANKTGLTLRDNSTDENLFGWVYGGGVEYAVGDGWSLKTEYLHFDFDDVTVSSLDSIGKTRRFTFENEIDTVKVGVNKRF